MSERTQQPEGRPPPAWAVDEASDELVDVDDPRVIAERAHEITEEREDERHDEYDDPDLGGEG